MRKGLRVLLLGAVFTVLLCTSALAVGEKGMYDVTPENGYGLTAQTAAQGTPSTSSIDIENVGEKTVSLDAERIAMTVTSPADSTQYLVFVLKGNTTNPTADNIVYIDQKSGTDAGTFDLYPSGLSRGVYTVCMSDTNNAVKKVGSFAYYAAYRLGFVSGGERITATDAQWALQICVGNRAGTDEQRLAANVDGDDRITATDAQWILQAAVGSRVL